MHWISSLLVLLYAYKLTKHPGAYQPWTDNLPLPIKYKTSDCKVSPGFKDLGDLPGSEDVEILDDYIFVSVGLRYDLFAHTLEPTKWQGVFVYDSKFPENQPTKIELKNANPHGISLFKISESTIRVFVVSHEKVTDNSGKEEIIIFDYDVVEKVKINEFRVVDELLVSVNDVKALSAEKFIASNDFLVRNHLIKKLFMYLFVPNANVVEITLKNTKVERSRVILSGLNMANGINYQKGRLVVNEPTFGIVNVFKWNFESDDLPVLDKAVRILMIADNVNFDSNGDMLVGGWMGPLMNSIRKNHNMKSMIVKIDKDNLEPVETIFYDLQGQFSVSSAAEYKNSVWIGSPTRPLLFCKH